MKGFAITLDAVVALAFFLFAVMIIGTQTYPPVNPGAIYLKQLTLDTLTVLEKTGRISQALDGNATSIQQVLEATPKLACMNLSIIDNQGNALISSVKSDCNVTARLDIQVTERPLLYQGGMYVIKTQSWFRAEPG